MASVTAMFLTGAETLTRIQQQNRQAKALTAQGTYEQQMFQRNADLADQQARDAIARGDVAAGVRGAETRQRVGSQRAAMAAQGIDLGTGSALDVQENEQYLSALDIATIKNNAAREAWGYKMQAADSIRRGTLAKATSDMEALSLRSDMGTTLLTGVTKSYGLWRDRRK